MKIYIGADRNMCRAAVPAPKGIGLHTEFA
ncbi:UNVERIFIED_ORG: hypothetical protein GGI63_001215 [Rhizobium esperanzae]